MEEKLSKWKEIKKRLKNSYRLIVLNNDTLEEVNTINLSLGNLYIIMCSAILLFGILFYTLFALTPMKRTIPGYGKIESNKELMTLFKKYNTLEKTVESQRVYINNFRHFVTGEIAEHKDTIDMEAEIVTGEEVKRVEEDEILRKEIEQEQILSDGLRADHGNKKIEFLHLVAPVKGTISTAFKPEINHYGIDILAPKNTAIKATLGGIVIASDWTLKTGNTITIQHDNNLISSYKHNSTLLKQAGDHVKSGEAIAIIGNSGTLSNGPHLHFELWQNGIPLNPEKCINF